MSSTTQLHRTMIGSALLALAILFFFPSAVLAQVPGAGDLAPQPDGPVATGVNLWLIVIGVGTRGLMYAINHYAPFLRTEPQKQIATALAGAIAGVLYQALSAGSLGWNDETLNAVLQATVFTLASHNLLYRPGGLNVKLGGGSNADGRHSV